MDIKEIQEHIRKLKCEETSWQSVEKLAALCTVRNELEEKEQAAVQESQVVDAYSYASEPQSDFVKAASAAPFDALMQILDKHMDGIKIVYPKEYTLVMQSIKAVL